MNRTTVVSLTALTLCAAAATGQTVTISTVGTNAYATGDINSCAIALNNITTYGGYQFVGYYNSSRNVVIGRRATGSTTWQTFDTGLNVSASQITDDHNIIALAVDGAGKMHLSWNMHNQSLNYAVSNASVLSATLPSVAFTTQTAANAPTLFSSSGATTNSVTYPIFKNIPGTNDLLFTYRNGGAGGGSGNGNQYFNVFSTATGTFTNTLAIDGIQTSVNAYLNNPVYDSHNNLLVSWTWRATSNWQTNSNIMFAQSPNNGTTWYKQGGTTPYALPIIQSGTPAAAVAEVVKAISQNSSFINQTSMTVDRNDHPVIATWYAPNAGNFNRQYMLVYHTDSGWRTSQITNRTSDTATDTSGANVRDLARPIVLVDTQNRVLVVTRSEDTAMGAAGLLATPNNNIVVYYSTNLASATPTWTKFVLDSANMGQWEPTYDENLWKAQNKLSLLYMPLGLTGQTTATAQVLEWNEQAYFAAIPEPSGVVGMGLLGIATVCIIRTKRRPCRSVCRFRDA